MEDILCTSQCVPVLVDCIVHIRSNFHKRPQAILSWWSRESSLWGLLGRGRTFCTEVALRTNVGRLETCRWESCPLQEGPQAWAVPCDGDGLNKDHRRRPLLQEPQVFEGSSGLLPHAMKRAPVLGLVQRVLLKPERLSESSWGLLKM